MVRGGAPPAAAAAAAPDLETTRRPMRRASLRGQLSGCLPALGAALAATAAAAACGGPTLRAIVAPMHAPPLGPAAVPEIGLSVSPQSNDASTPPQAGEVWQTPAARPLSADLDTHFRMPSFILADSGPTPLDILTETGGLPTVATIRTNQDAPINSLIHSPGDAYRKNGNIGDAEAQPSSDQPARASAPTLHSARPKVSAQRDMTSRRGHATLREVGRGSVSSCERVREVSAP